jgi:hypothetical protein
MQTGKGKLYWRAQHGFSRSRPHKRRGRYWKAPRVWSWQVCAAFLYAASPYPQSLATKESPWRSPAQQDGCRSQAELPARAQAPCEDMMSRQPPHHWEIIATAVETAWGVPASLSKAVAYHATVERAILRATTATCSGSRRLAISNG